MLLHLHFRSVKECRKDQVFPKACGATSERAGLRVVQPTIQVIREAHSDEAGPRSIQERDSARHSADVV